MMRKYRKFGPGDKVFAKVRGYPPWPARIVGVADESSQISKMRYHIYFYGTGESAVVKAEDVFLFVEHRNGKLGKPRKLKGFNEAIAEIEAELSPEEKEQMVSAENTENADSSMLSDDGGPLNVSGRRQSTSGTSKQGKVLDSSPSTSAAADILQSKTASPQVPETKAVKSRKRKSEMVESGSSEPTEPKKARSSSINREPVEEEVSHSKGPTDIMSRSGRKIKPKKFSDFEGSADEEVYSIKVPKSPVKPVEKVKEKETKPVKVEPESPKDSDNYIKFVFNNESVKIPLKLNRPTFKNPKSPIDWDQMVLKQALSLKEDVLSGEIFPDRVSKIMEDWTREKAVEMKKAFEEEDIKYSVLKTEGKLLQLDLKIKSSLTLAKAEPKECLTHLDELLALPVSTIMLKKHPEVVETIKRMRRYVGNTSSWNLSEEELREFNTHALNIRKKSDHVFNKFKSLFLVPQGKTFWSVFSKELEDFQKKTQNLSQEKLFSIVKEPF